MRLTYLSEANIPSRSSNATQTMRMCAAFAEAGAEVTLVHPVSRRDEPEGFGGDVEEFYGVRAHFERNTLRSPSLPGGGAGERVARALPFMAHLGLRARPGRPPFTCYARSLSAAWIAVRVRRLWGRRGACEGVVVELHDEPASGAWALLGAVDGIVTISDALRRRISEEQPALAERIWVEHDGVDLGAVDRDTDRDAARRRLGLEGVAGPLVVYTGRAIAGKGVDVLIAAARHLEDIGARVLVVGKVYEDEYREQAPPNVSFTGFVAPAEVPAYLAAADVLVMPTTEDLRYSAYTSPLKLFEYMASGRPVVASDLPVLREVVADGENALLYPVRDPAALAGAVRRLWSEPELSRVLAERAWHDVQYYGWRARAARILGRIEAIAAPRTVR